MSRLARPGPTRRAPSPSFRANRSTAVPLLPDHLLGQRQRALTVADSIRRRCREQTCQRVWELWTIGGQVHVFQERIPRRLVALQPDERERVAEPRLPDAGIHFDRLGVLSQRFVDVVRAVARHWPAARGLRGRSGRTARRQQVARWPGRVDRSIEAGPRDCNGCPQSQVIGAGLPGIAIPHLGRLPSGTGLWPSCA